MVIEDMKMDQVLSSMGENLSAVFSCYLSLITVSKLKGNEVMQFQVIKLIYTTNNMLSCM